MTEKIKLCTYEIKAVRYYRKECILNTLDMFFAAKSTSLSLRKDTWQSLRGVSKVQMDYTALIAQIHRIMLGILDMHTFYERQSAIVVVHTIWCWFSFNFFGKILVLWTDLNWRSISDKKVSDSKFLHHARNVR